MTPPPLDRFVSRAELNRRIQQEAQQLPPGQAVHSNELPAWVYNIPNTLGNRYMHEAIRIPAWRQGVLHAWHSAGKPEEMSEDHAAMMMEQALNAGYGSTALQVHGRVPDNLKIDKTGDLMDQYRRSALPPIHLFQLQVDPTPDRGWKKAFDDYVRAGYPVSDANAFVRQKR